MVQKFGGTSVADNTAREKVYEKIIAAKKKGYFLVVVISAMGRKGAPYATDTLLDLLKTEYEHVSKREQDSIFVCGEIISGTIIAANLQKRGYKSVFLTGWQAGITTNNRHGDANIINVDTKNILKYLNEDHIVIVGGGQGISTEKEITTLGRGGSDTTACALGAALNSESIEIYKDVDGMLTANPVKVPGAGIIKSLTYDEAFEMAYAGAKILHPRAVEIAKQWRIPIKIKPTFSDSPGTIISETVENIKPGCDYIDKDAPTAIAEIEDLEILKMSLNDYFMIDENLRLEMACRKLYSMMNNNYLFYIFKKNDFRDIKVELKNKEINRDVIENCWQLSIISCNSDKNRFEYSMMEFFKARNIEVIYTVTGKYSLKFLLKSPDVDSVIQDVYDKLFLYKN